MDAHSHGRVCTNNKSETINCTILSPRASTLSCRGDPREKVDGAGLFSNEVFTFDTSNNAFTFVLFRVWWGHQITMRERRALPHVSHMDFGKIKFRLSYVHLWISIQENASLADSLTTR